MLLDTRVGEQSRRVVLGPSWLGCGNTKRCGIRAEGRDAEAVKERTGSG